MTITTSPTPADIIDEVRAIGTHAIHTAETVRADAAQQIHALEVTVARLAAERDREKTRADGLHAANLALVADHLRRQEQLQAEARMYEHVSHHLQDALDAKHLELRRVSELFAEQFAANQALRTELANQPKPWWRRHTQDH